MSGEKRGSITQHVLQLWHYQLFSNFFFLLHKNPKQNVKSNEIRATEQGVLLQSGRPLSTDCHRLQGDTKDIQVHTNTAAGPTYGAVGLAIKILLSVASVIVQQFILLSTKDEFQPQTISRSFWLHLSLQYRTLSRLQSFTQTKSSAALVEEGKGNGSRHEVTLIENLHNWLWWLTRCIPSTSAICLSDPQVNYSWW